MLNYLGPNIGPGPVTSMLPPATPGTMPDGINGIPSTQAPPPPQNIHPAPPPPQAVHNKMQGHTPASALAAIMRHASGPSGPLAPPTPKNEYEALTQDDGSILLHIKNPNGSLGPVVKVIPPVKRPT